MITNNSFRGLIDEALNTIVKFDWENDITPKQLASILGKDNHDIKNSEYFNLCARQYRASSRDTDVGISTSSHVSKRDMDDAVQKLSVKDVAKNHVGIVLHWLYEDMAKNFTCSFKEFDPQSEIKILFLDDNLDVIKDKIRCVKNILDYKLGNNVVEIVSNDDLRQADDSQVVSQLKNIYDSLAKGEECYKSPGNPKQSIHWKNYRYIFTDLLMGDDLLGLKIINKLSELRQYHDYKYEIIALSRSTNTEDIQKALNFGASLYIPKERIFSIPYRLVELGASSPQSASGKNTFNSLLKLPARYIKALQTQRISNTPEDEAWVKKLPKADIHVHLGGYLDAEITLKLSVYNTMMALYTFCREGKFAFADDEVNGSTLREYIDDTKGFKDLGSKLDDLKVLLGEIFTMAGRYRSYANELNKYSRATGKRKLDYIKIISAESFFEQTASDLRYQMYQLQSHHVASMFNVALCFEAEDNIMDIKVDLSTQAKDDNIDVTSGLSTAEILKKIFQRFQIKFTAEKKEAQISVLGNSETLDITFEDTKPQTLQKLLTATHGNKLEDAIGGITLNAFLKGCDYTGSDVMQSKYTITQAIKHICTKANDDNVTLLELRATPLNFCRGGLSPDDVWNAFNEGYNQFRERTTELGPQSDLILTFVIALKRHYKDKSMIGKNIKFGTDHDFYQENGDKKINHLLLTNLKPFISGFDLTGQEDKFNPGEFRKNFSQIFESCMPITIHAGEETPSKYIWEAAYELNADRIGHGLSLAKLKTNNTMQLMNRFRDFNKCVELCPTSNFLTQKGMKYYKNISNKNSYVKYASCKPGATDSYLGDNYPTGVFLDQKLNFTICTDDPAIQDSSLTKEYLWASMMTKRGKADHTKIGITKWEALQIIYNGFNYAFLPDDLKTLLLSRTENMVFDILESSRVS